MKKSASELIARLLSVILILTVSLQGLAIRAFADDAPSLNLVFSENAEVSVDGGRITVTDTDDNNDVWNSKALFEAAGELEPGKEYTITLDLSGSNGVGEFFVCKSANPDDRYDETFVNAAGGRTVTFIAMTEKLFIGIQCGNLGKGNSVTVSIEKMEVSAAPVVEISTAVPCSNVTLKPVFTENADVSMDEGRITVTDTDDNNDVWNSKVLLAAAEELEIGMEYSLTVNLSGSRGVGEFFVCKSDNMDDRYDATFINTSGSKTISFMAQSSTLYLGIQCGNLGKGNSVTLVVEKLEESKPVPAGESGNPADEDTVSFTTTVTDGVLTIEATDLSDNNDVWESVVLCDIYQDMIPGERYEVSFELNGENGVGEFFLCKSADINDRYDSTFTNANGLNTVIFTAEGTHAYVGMQLGNIGNGNTVTAKILSLKSYDPDAAGTPGVLVAQNCEQTVVRTVTENVDSTVITMTDTDDSNDIWTSKLLYYFGDILQAGRDYIAKINLSGDEIGEFFFLKSRDMGDRYSFDNTSGDHTVTFTAESDQLYAGVQFGNIGNGSNFVVTITDLFEKPFESSSTENCTEEMSRGAVTVTDTSDNNDVWNSKAVYNTGITLVPGQEYNITFVLTGENAGEFGEFFFLKSNDISDRYSFNDTPGEHTVTFTAVSDELFMGIQCGNLGNGNSMTVSDITVTEANAQTFYLAAFSADEEAAVEETAEEIAEEPVEEIVEQSIEETDEEAAEETAEEIIEETVEETVEEVVEESIEGTAEEQSVSEVSAEN